MFAGTTERVCLIQGTVEALNGVHDFIAEKVREMPQSTQKTEPVSILQPQTTVNPDRVKQVSVTPPTPFLLTVEPKARAQNCSTECVLLAVLVCASSASGVGECVRSKAGVGGGDDVCLWNDKLCVFLCFVYDFLFE